ncbi:hypothetical protein UlMin_041672 [Ulmus minor]
MATGTTYTCRRFMTFGLGNLELKTPIRGRNRPLSIPQPGDRVTIAKGHKNYDLMLNLQLGIRPAPTTSLDLKSSAFDPKEKLWKNFPPEGSKYTLPHASCDFRWKDYCPIVFRSCNYMISICGNDAFQELSSRGKSGSFFYLTYNDRYMIKTIKKVLLRMLPAYCKHVQAFKNTLVTKFYGLYCVKLTGATQKKFHILSQIASVRFVIMGNLFCSEYTIHRHFDLKGSSHGCTTDKPEGEIDVTTTLKDLDLNYIFRLGSKTSTGELLVHFSLIQVDRDCDFLEQERIVDYSMLVGLHFCKTSSQERSTPSGPRLTRVDTRSIRLGISMPARDERTIRRNEYEAQLEDSPNEFNPRLLDLHSFNTELLPEVGLRAIQ